MTGSAPDRVLEVEGLEVVFPTEDGTVHAVRSVSYGVRPGEVLGIVGESGSGKSVSSLAIMGLLPRGAQVAGSVRLLGRELLGLKDRELAAVRGRHVAMVFQDPLTSLTPVYTVGRQLVEAIQAHHPRTRSALRRARAIELLETVGIPDASHRVDAYPHELSGGMRQRVVIAMEMANEPEVIIADEPTTALDVTVQAQVLEALDRAREATGAAMVLITHDLGVIAGQADRVAVMYAGRIVEIGSVEDVFERPRMPYTLGLLGSLPRLDARVSTRLTPIGGTPPSLLQRPQGCPFAPRCPLARDECVGHEPELVSVGDPDHVAACHHHVALIGRAPEDVFVPRASGVETPRRRGGDVVIAVRDLVKHFPLRSRGSASARGGGGARRGRRQLRPRVQLDVGTRGGVRMRQIHHRSVGTQRDVGDLGVGEVPRCRTAGAVGAGDATDPTRCPDRFPRPLCLSRSPDDGGGIDRGTAPHPRGVGEFGAGSGPGVARTRGIEPRACEPLPP